MYIIIIIIPNWPNYSSSYNVIKHFMLFRLIKVLFYFEKYYWTLCDYYKYNVYIFYKNVKWIDAIVLAIRWSVSTRSITYHIDTDNSIFYDQVGSFMFFFFFFYYKCSDADSGLKQNFYHYVTYWIPSKKVRNRMNYAWSNWRCLIYVLETLCIHDQTLVYTIFIVPKIILIMHCRTWDTSG